MQVGKIEQVLSEICLEYDKITLKWWFSTIVFMMP